MTIGFIGLGMMGYPMAHLLASAGHSLRVHDLSQSTVQRFVAEHSGVHALEAGNGLSELDIVITMLPDSNAVEATVLGTPDKPGLASALRKGSVIIDMSSSEPLRSRELAATLASRGIDYLDAPVSGGVKRAVNGTLAIMVGGEPAVIDRYRPVLDVMGKNITVVGKAGAGHAMKALNNYVSAAGLVAAVEALHVGQAFGLDPHAMTDVLNSSTGKNNTTENKVKQFMLSGAYNSGFSLALMAKDLGIAMGLGKSLNQPMELGDQLLELWRSANEELGKGADHTEMYRFQENKTK
jgi:3-hydroxyisobutyrate dehydrogenase